MAEHLEEVMSHAYQQIEERQRLEANTSLLKTFLIEAHAAKPAHKEIRLLLQTAFGPETLGRNSQSVIAETDEEFFFNVNVRWATNDATVKNNAINAATTFPPSAPSA